MTITRAESVFLRHTGWVLAGAMAIALGVRGDSVLAQASRNTSGGSSWTQSNNAYSSGTFGGMSGSSGSGSSGNRSGSGGTSTGTGSLSNRLNQAASGSSDFSRSSRGADNFVGADSSDTRNLLGYENSSQSTSRSGRNARSTSRSGNSSFGNRSGNRGFTGGGYSSYGMQGNRSRSGQSVDVQPTLSLGFDYVGSAAPDLTAKLATKFKPAVATGISSTLKVELQEGVAVLTGTVASDHQRALAAQLISLEPGVRRVDNRLAVAAPPTN